MIGRQWSIAEDQQLLDKVEALVQQHTAAPEARVSDVRGIRRGRQNNRVSAIQLLKGWRSLATETGRSEPSLRRRHALLMKRQDDITNVFGAVSSLVDAVVEGGLVEQETLQRFARAEEEKRRAHHAEETKVIRAIKAMAKSRGRTNGKKGKRKVSHAQLAEIVQNEANVKQQKQGFQEDEIEFSQQWNCQS